MRGHPTLWQVAAPLVWLAFGIGLLVALSALSPDVLFARLIGPYLWDPLVRDTGFNAINTAVLFAIAVALTLWIHRLLARHGVPLDMGLIVAPIVLLPTGSLVRVLVDSDFFAPFDQDLLGVRPDLGAGATCVAEVGGSLLDQCMSLFLITPPIYILFVLLLGGLGRLAYEGERVRRATGAATSLRFEALALAAGLVLYLAWWASRPAYVRLVPPPWWATLAFAFALALLALHVRLRGRADWRVAFFVFLLALALLVVYPALVWLRGGVEGWRPEAPVRPLLAPLAVGVVVLLVLVVSWRARLRAGRPTARHGGFAWTGLGVDVTLLAFSGFLVLAFAATRGNAGPAGLANLSTPWVVAAVAVSGFVLGGAWLRARRGLDHPSMQVLSQPHNQLVLGAQLLDALMTSLGLDAYGASEKHLVPRTLVAWVDGLGLPGLLGEVPTALVFIPLKVALTLALLWALDVRYEAELRSRPNAVALVKAVAFVVGLGPGARDLARLTMGV